ncbi:MAG: shikimate kinase, partial [Bacteroidetes bacterium]|nr:shikimate kinase [Bacteroidota bacterium]
MSVDKKIFLIGFMGAGKSSVGKKLAQSLHYRFVDLDVLIEKQQKKSIPGIFEKEGEDGFRKIEQQALHNLKDESNIVVATGGGCPTFEKNMEWMNAHGKTIYLNCSIGVLFHRIAPKKKQRPLLAHLDDVDIMDFMVTTLKERSGNYEKANFVVDGDGKVEEVIRRI